ncbi:WXG100 family type VII secretion target [Clostridium felsineum]|uniref:WXG100 family type VII secretion target n=1 Tax=Clostridium felsineum TaxID=36839 RepID=UPI00098C8A39|nr:WXG100 family type VII secretion target [Clostridium felsineum]URZ15209.1 hypothetical protein CLFE_012270 [Clostridium felsineum DSM 794]
MADKIKVGLNELMHASDMFDKAAKDCAEIKQNIESATEKLTDNWNGESYKAFVKTYFILDRNMDTYTEILEEYSKALIDIAQVYKNRDEATAKAMSKAIKETSEAKQQEQLEEEKRKMGMGNYSDSPSYSGYPAASQYYENQTK